VNGDGVKRDPGLGYALVSRAAAQGLAPAKETLAQLDQVLPLDLRKKSVVVAIAKANAAPPPRSKPVEAKPKPIAVAEAKPAKIVAPAAAAASAEPVATTGAWRVQLGAFSQRSSAEALYRKLSGDAALAGRHAFYIPVGAITRLQVGPFENKAAAAAACRAVGTACFPVPAK
jgi:cell division septation protein DedD